MTAESSPDPSATDTIALIHGLWMTPRSWEKRVERYEGRGYRVLALAYPDPEGLPTRRPRPEGASCLPEDGSALPVYEGIRAAAPLPYIYCWGVYGEHLSRGG